MRRVGWCGEGGRVSFCASVRNGVRVGANALVGMGAVVRRDVQPGATVYGVPARQAPQAPPTGTR